MVPRCFVTVELYLLWKIEVGGGDTILEYCPLISGNLLIIVLIRLLPR